MESFKSYFNGDASIELLKKVTKNNWPDFDAFNDVDFNTPRRHIRHTVSTNNYDYEIKPVPVDSITPSQHGEDYMNDSSKHTAKKIREQDTNIRIQDLMPILLDTGNKINDGNHRHAASVINKQQNILALVPVRPGNGNVLNMEEFYKYLK
jgi:hypothetical protein